jgi:hypothetical protein
MRRLRVAPRVGALLLLIAAQAGCSSGGSSSSPTSTRTGSAIAATIGPAAEPAGSDRPDVGAATSTSSPTSATPGADSADAQPGDSAPAGAGSPAADACSLITPTDIRNATGTDFGNPQAETPQQTQYGTYTACTWLQAGSPLTSVRVTVWDDDKAYDDARRQLGDTNDLGEIGDRAFAATLASVYAAVNGHALFVQYSNFDNDDATNLPISVELAEVAATNL